MFKKSLIFLFILFNSLSFSQSPFEWPNELKINPNHYELRQLGIKKVEQIKRYGPSYKFADSTKYNSEYLDYVITYDTNQRITSFKYDFINHFYYSDFFGDSTKLDSIKRLVQREELPIYFIKLNNTWVAKNHWEVLFTYNSYGLANIGILNPYLRLGTRGVLDGVYTKPTKRKEVKTISYSNEFGEIIRQESYSGGELIHLKLYDYQFYENNGKSARLLHSVEEDGIVYQIHYYFN